MVTTGRMENRRKSTRGLLAARGIRSKSNTSLHITDGQRMVYDAVIDDVSVVGNYRAQFARILQTVPLEELIQKLRAKASGR